MEFHRTNVSFFIFIILFSSGAIQFGSALRPLHEKHSLMKKYFPNLINQSLQRGPVPPIAGSPCTHIPGNGGGPCPNLNGMNFAGRALRPLHEKHSLMKKYFPNLIKQSLQRGPVPPIAGSPCTHIPGNGGGPCPNLNGMNFAGRVFHSPPSDAYPATIVEF